MKRSDFLSFLLDTVLACTMAIAGVGCLATAFSLSVEMEAVVWTALIASLLTSLCIRLRRGWLLLVLTALCGGLLLHRLDFISNACSMLRYVLSIYDMGYGWGVPQWLEGYQQWNFTLTLQVIAGVCAVLAAITLAKCMHPLELFSVLLPLLPCIVVVDTVPDGAYLLWAILPVALLALTRQARLRDTRQANRLTAMLLIPVILSGMLLFARNPRQDYQAPDGAAGFFDMMEQLAQKLPFWNMETDDPEIPVYPVADSVSLDTLGPRPTQYSKVLEVISSQTGPQYLRGRSYAGYTGLAWEAWQTEESFARPLSAYLQKDQQTMQVKDLKGQPVRYFPYYVNQGLVLSDGALPQLETITYLFAFYPLSDQWQRTWQTDYANLTVENSVYATMQAYVQLPEETWQRAQSHLAKAGVQSGDNLLRIVRQIGDYVQNSAKYDTETTKMPQGQKDFALWFLEESEVGYCSHFASAAAVLLRAAGIPARYVEGYLVETVAGQTSPVRSRNAHAWVEYYVPYVGWVVLETTPSEGLPVQLPTQVPTTEPTVPTQPPTQVPTTEPTQPTEPTTPTEPTEPTMPTIPTEPTQPTQPVTRPTQPTQPATGGDDPQDPEPKPARDWTWLWSALAWMGRMLALAALVLGQWRLRLWLRKKAMTGSSWKAIWARWRYACFLGWLCGHKKPEPLLYLLKKAKYSRNGLSAMELARFDRYSNACIRGLQRRCWPIRWIYRLILAAW